jgi:hypothetical protein
LKQSLDHPNFGQPTFPENPVDPPGEYGFPKILVKIFDVKKYKAHTPSRLSLGQTNLACGFNMG